MNATSGHTSWTPFAYYDPNSRSLKTSQATLDLDLTPSSLTLPRSGGMRNGQLYERVTSEHHTVVSDSSLLPTPVASDHKRRDSPADRRRKSPGITTCTSFWPGLTEPPTSTTN